MIRFSLSVILFIALLAGCIYSPPSPVKVAVGTVKINYLHDVKPILDRRCVSCHSCYNSPCQAKFSSFDGIDRGGSKEKVYQAKRLFPQKPTRLFVDAKTTSQWREKKFFSLTQDLGVAQEGEALDGVHYVSSVMGHMIHDKKLHPEIIGEYAPETDKLICAQNLEELGKYQKRHPNHGMPYGFPALEDKEYDTIMQWLAQGAKGPSSSEQEKLQTPSSRAQKEIDEWEGFLNAKDPKHQLTARYLYEHYFLAHINFKAAPNEFYRLIRSSSPTGQKPDTLTTLRPYDKPEVDTFYYRFEKIYSTIVHKTHMVVVFDAQELQRVKELFIQTPWLEEPHLMGYDATMSANPFLIYAQIPPSSRYGFLLDHNEYITRTFIRGPICKGQIALSVIRDHFWILFQDPKYDIGVTEPEFLKQQAQNLRLPIEKGSYSRIYKTFSDEYKKGYKAYYDAKIDRLSKRSPQGLPIESVWKGRRSSDAPVLSAYRHFDSASLYKGTHGELPGTIWMLDYAQFERIYYTLVAGFDVFGNVSHQLNVRRYMDFLRLEAELNFITYLPKEKRADIFSSWYLGDGISDDIQDEAGYTADIGNAIEFKTDKPKQELMECLVDTHFLKGADIHFDGVNYFRMGEKLPSLPGEYKTEADLIQGLRSLTAPGTGFIRHMVDGGVNLAYVRVHWKSGKQTVTSLVVNRWHDNVNALLGEKKRLDPSKDTLDILAGSIGSYPNAFFDVQEEELPDFFDMIKNFEKSEIYYNKAKKYAISRSDKKFWNYFDWFQNRFYEEDPLNAGLYDLNRYYKVSW